MLEHHDEAGKTHCSTNGLVGDIIASSFKLHKSKGGIFLKLHFDLPWGGQMTIEREPMKQDRFFAVCVLIGIYIVGSGFLKFFALMV